MIPQAGIFVNIYQYKNKNEGTQRKVNIKDIQNTERFHLNIPYNIT